MPMTVPDEFNIQSSREGYRQRRWICVTSVAALSPVPPSKIRKGVYVARTAGRKGRQSLETFYFVINTDGQCVFIEDDFFDLPPLLVLENIGDYYARQAVEIGIRRAQPERQVHILLAGHRIAQHSVARNDEDARRADTYAK